MIQLKPVDRDNFRAVLKLSVSEDQKRFVASNAFSLAQAYAQPECTPLAVYSGDALVGFVMYAMDEEDKEYCIYRVMIAADHQGKGYGRAAMLKLIEHIREDRSHHVIYISFVPENAPARALYESLGFRPDGRIIEGEVVMMLEEQQA